MKRFALPLAAISLAASSLPASAQATLSPAAEEALQCAMWASYFSVALEGEEESAALTNALTFFVGRYEGLTGQGVDAAVYEVLIVDTLSDIDGLTPVCVPLMEQFGERLLNWSRVLDAVSGTIEEDVPPDVTQTAPRQSGESVAQG